MDINHKDLDDGEFKVLVIEKLDTIIKNDERRDKRLDSHSNQLKAIWGIGGLSGVIGIFFKAKSGQ